MDFDFCRTLAEVSGRLDGSPAAPIFAHTRSLNLHVAAVRYGAVPPGESYPGFHAPYASRVFHLDECFGRFVDLLKARGLYDHSLIVLTADHGERLGEDGQWGHSYHMTPEVIQIPLLIRVPVRYRRGEVDREAVALSTDIVPTLYDALGYEPRESDGLIGRSLIEPPGAAGAARWADYVLAASYGAVYVALRRNGRMIYIADAISARDQAFRRSGDGWIPVEVSDDMRGVNQALIRIHVDRVSRAYGLTPRT
jgi:membrane-anchored protein YejM (alkaline phosphatase superfamily)